MQPRKAGASLSHRNLAAQQDPPLAQFASAEKLGFSSEDVWIDSETLAEVLATLLVLTMAVLVYSQQICV